MNYSAYQHLWFEHMANGIPFITISRPEQHSAVNARLPAGLDAFLEERKPQFPSNKIC